jgi:amino-acid N-acetyltransferase
LEDALIRKATMADVPDMHRLITYHAELNRMLFRSHADLYEHIRDFFVDVEASDGGQRVRGCTALELVWRDLAEVKSLAVDESFRGRGIGSRLVRAAVDEARSLGLGRIFALTRDRPFFEKLGFGVVPRETLPHKVWTDCVRCPLQEHCDEIAMVLQLVPGSAPSATPLAAAMAGSGPAGAAVTAGRSGDGSS